MMTPHDEYEAYLGRAEYVILDEGFFVHGILLSRYEPQWLSDEHADLWVSMAEAEIAGQEWPGAYVSADQPGVRFKVKKVPDPIDVESGFGLWINPFVKKTAFQRAHEKIDFRDLIEVAIFLRRLGLHVMTASAYRSLPVMNDVEMAA